MIIDHIGIAVADYRQSREFYCAALAPLGIGLVMEIEGWTGYRHVTDRGILTELTAALGIAERESVIARARAAFGRRVESYFDAGGTCRAIPGARETLVCLIENGFRVGIATGGWRHTAGMKLEQAGIDTAALLALVLILSLV